jgi:hypothetical protein
MRHANQLNVFVLAIFLLTGCGTTSATRSRNYQAAESSPPAAQREYDTPEPEPLPKGPPPPAPPAYGVSHVKSVGFLRVFGARQKQTCSTDDHCATDNCETDACCSQNDCAESDARKPGLLSCLRNGCCFDFLKGCKETACVKEQECCAPSTCDECGDDCCAENGCSDDRHPCLAERLEDPFLDDAVPELDNESEHQSPVPAAPEPNLQPHAWLPSPYSEISTSRTLGGAYFPTASNSSESIVEPEQWQGHRNVQRVITHQPIALETTTDGTAFPVIRQPVIHEIVIRPR